MSKILNAFAFYRLTIFRDYEIKKITSQNFYFNKILTLFQIMIFKCEQLTESGR